jgi:iron(III) transport system permease protein
MERSRRWNRILDLLALLPFALPGTVLGIGLIILWNRPLTQWIYGSSLILLIAYLAHFAPFTIRIMAANIKQVDLKLEEAAHLASSSWFAIVRKILLPLMRPGLFLSLFLGFILCFGDLAAPLLVMPPGRETVPIKIYNLLHYGAEQMVAALCLVVVLIIFIAAGILYMVYDRYGKIK